MNLIDKTEPICGKCPMFNPMCHVGTLYTDEGAHERIITVSCENIALCKMIREHLETQKEEHA